MIIFTYLFYLIFPLLPGKLSGKKPGRVKSSGLFIFQTYLAIIISFNLLW